MFSRITVLALTALFAGASAKTVINADNGDVMATEALMKNARKLNNNNNYNNGNNNQDFNWDDVDISFLSGYSMKFQGCHHVQQWNEDAEDEEDIRIKTQRLVRFRMCPANSCEAGGTSLGCSADYGDYVVDMETYLEAYLNQMQQNYMNNNGQRQLANNGNSNIDLSSLMTCQAMQNNNNGGRKLANNGNNYYYDNDVQYYVGPYCAEQGGQIHIGVFMDDTCTVFADEGEEVFKMQHNGVELPYASQSVVNLNCMACGAYGEVSETCQDIYKVAGKCETKMGVYYPNESACGYISGIKIIREDGVIRTSATHKSKTASVFIGLFLTAAVLLAGYVYYLRTKLGRAKINLAAASQNI
eukprot:CAMPEP_0113459794 /NCGR_PEP_ID=MMETSP0014_2-20120614/10646_1 /TAXON_ID=2857 /ORGANISM="Nitzschia sp." /LENGTH=357 /DNA_ID=CAMNT_0000351409 /DNA_START=411 /DNA_END=1484 /DNA_ORIENTATION=- /assembly_acc=CAM_ASM_000159